MYSSSPHIIKHYIPISFSKQILDSQYSSTKKIQQNQIQNPFKNNKLKNIDKFKKDYVLIFKNKSFKQFRAKKQIQPIPLLKNIKMAHKKCTIMRQTQKNTYNILFQNDPYSSIKAVKKPFTSLNKRGQPQSPFIHQNPERNIRTSYSSLRGTSKGITFQDNMFIINNVNNQKNSINEAISNQIILNSSPKQFKRSKNTSCLNLMKTAKSENGVNQNNAFLTRSTSIDLSNKINYQNIIQQRLSIKGNKAPTSETIDHWKRNYSNEIYHIVDRILQ